MSNPTNAWKLGLFVLTGIAAAGTTVLFFGARSLRTENVAYKSFFDESVQGLDVGSPVKFRGVSIGSVAHIDVAPDHRQVEVSYRLGVKDLNALGLSEEESQGLNTKMKIPPDLRVQLVSAGITGVKFLQIDFFNEQEYPPLTLPFETPENYIPTANSVMKNLESSVVHAVDRLPLLADQLLVVLGRISDILGDVEKKHVPEKAIATLANIDAVLFEARAAITAMEVGKISHSAQETIGTLNTAVTHLTEILVRVGGERGLVASGMRTSDSMGNMAQGATHVGPALEDTLRDVQSAAQAIQRLADALERDPDMLIKGKAKRGSK